LAQLITVEYDFTDRRRVRNVHLSWTV